MKDGIKDKVLRIFTIFFVLAILVGGFVFVWPTYMRGRALKQKDAEMDARIEKKRQEIEEFRNFQRRYGKDSDFVETIARQNRRVFPGELVFIFEDD